MERVDEAGGAAVSSVKTAEMITERDRNLFFEMSVDMLCIAGFDGHFKRLNPAWERTLGWSIEEMLSRPWLEFVHPDDVQSTIEAGEQLLAGQTIFVFENRYRCKDGSYR
jgi:PAS domain S-box-containing protein